MAAIDNLNSNILALTAEVDIVVAALAAPPPNQDPAIQAAADNVATQTARLVAAAPAPAIKSA